MRARCCGNRYPLTRLDNVTAIVKFQFSEQLHRTTKYVILSGVRSTESKNLRISSTFAVKPVQRSFDSA